MIHWTEQQILRVCSTLLQCNTHCVISVLLCSEILVERSYIRVSGTGTSVFSLEEHGGMLTK